MHLPQTCFLPVLLSLNSFKPVNCLKHEGTSPVNGLNDKDRNFKFVSRQIELCIVPYMFEPCKSRCSRLDQLRKTLSKTVWSRYIDGCDRSRLFKCNSVAHSERLVVDPDVTYTSNGHH